MSCYAVELDFEQNNRYQHIIKDYRCVVCQNQSLAESDNAFSESLRLKIKVLILENKTNDDIDKYLTDRYGDYVSYQPPFNLQTFLLWGVPLLFMMNGLRLLVRG